jgi:hypothetical protein
LCALIIPATALTASQYSTVASVIQAAAVIPAIVIAALALNRDSRDKRVDRVLELHRELNSGELKEAKRRLTSHLREHGPAGHVRPTTYEELRDDPVMSKYSSEPGCNPRSDASEILRLFERANAARITGIIDEPLFVELICRHATWWNLAIKDSSDLDQNPRAHLRELAQWADAFALRHRRRYSYLRNWGQNRRREYGADAVSDGVSAMPVTQLATPSQVPASPDQASATSPQAP